MTHRKHSTIATILLLRYILMHLISYTFFSTLHLNPYYLAPESNKGKGNKYLPHPNN